MQRKAVPDGALLDELAFLQKRISELEAINGDYEQVKSALMEAEEKWRAFVQNPYDFVVILGRDGTFQYVNHTAPGIRKEDLVGVATIHDYIAPEFRSQMRKSIDYVFETGVSTHFEAYSPQADIWGANVLSPLKKDGKVVAALSISRNITEVKRTEEEIRRLARQKAVLVKIGQIITSSLDIDEVYERFAEYVSKLIPSDRIAIGLIDYATQTYTHYYIWGTNVLLRRRGDSVPLDGSLAGESVKSRRAVIIQTDDRSEIERRFPVILAYFDAGLRSFLTVPLISEDEVFGFIHFRSSKPDAYTEHDIELAESIGSQIAGAVANSRLHADLQRKSEEREVMIEIGRIIVSSPNINDVYERFAEQVRKLIPFDRANINLVDLEQGTMRHAYSIGMDWLDEGKIPLVGSVTAKVIETRSGLIVQPDPENEAELTENYPVAAAGYRAGLVSCICVPLFSQDKAVGSLNLRSTKSKAYSQSDLELAERVGAQIAGAIANAQLREHAQREAKEKQALAEIGRIISSSLDIDEVYERFAEQFRNLVPSDRIAIALIDEASQTAVHTYIWGRYVELRHKGDAIPLEGSTAGEAFKSRSPMLLQTEDRKEIQDRVPALLPFFDAGIRSFLTVPLISKDVVVGVLYLATNESGAYTQHDVELAESVGAQIAGAIDNAQLYEGRKRVEEALRINEDEQRRLARENEVLAEIGRIISASLDINKVYERFVEQVRILINFDRITINLIDSEARTVDHAYVWGEFVPNRNAGDVIPMDGTQAGDIFEKRSGQVISANNRAELENRLPGLLPLYDCGMRSFLSAPLISNDKVIGVLHIRSKQQNVYNKRHIKIAERVGAQIAGAIANSQLFEERKRAEKALRVSEEEQRQLARENETIAHIGRIVGSSLDIDKIYESFAEQIGSLVQFDRIVVTDMDEQRDTMAVQYVGGMELPGWEKGSIRRISGKIGERLLLSRSGIMFGGESLEEIVENFPNQNPIIASGLKSLIAVPLVSNDRVIATLHLRSKKPNAYTESDLELLERAGAQIAGAIANAQLHAALQHEATEREVLAEIGRIISSSLDIKQVYELFAEQVRRLINFDRTAITIVQPDDDTFYTAYELGTKLDNRAIGQIFPLSGTLTEHVVKAKFGRLIHYEDRQELAKAFSGFLPSFDAGLRSGIAIPLISSDEAVGALFLESISPHAYSQRDLELAERVGAQIAGAIANARLYADRMEAQEALRQSVERFDLAVRGSSEGLWDRRMARDASDLFDPNAEIYYSPRFKEMLGYNDNEFPNVNASWNTHIHPEDRERAFEALRNHIEKGVPYDVEFRLRTKSGKYRWFSSRGQAGLHESENRIRMAGSLRDITERRRLETQLLQSQKMEALGTLTGGIAHDFNNLLTAILGYAQLGLLTLQPGDRLYNNLQEIEKAAERASGLTRQLLTFSRSQMISPRILNLNDLVLDIDNMLRRLIGEDIELVTLPSPKLNLVKIDPSQMEQVIINLVVNSRDAMPDGGKILIKTANVAAHPNDSWDYPELSPGNYVMVTVEDTGTGMDEEVMERVFDPFFTTKETGKGTGLGLSTCYGIVSQAGGNITIESVPGEGSTFKIFLPKVEDALDITPVHTQAGYLPRGNETVLLVEDEPSVREIATHVLREQGYRVIQADNGVEALRIVNDNPDLEIDLLLTDVVMPLMGGRELVHKIREIYPQVKVLYTSGYADHNVVHRSMIKDGADYMQKPFTPAVLARKVREVIDR